SRRGSASSKIMSTRRGCCRAGAAFAVLPFQKVRLIRSRGDVGQRWLSRHLTSILFATWSDTKNGIWPHTKNFSQHWMIPTRKFAQSQKCCCIEAHTPPKGEPKRCRSLVDDDISEAAFLSL